MTQDDAFTLCEELERLVGQQSPCRSMLLRVREIEGAFFADVEADGQLLTQVTRVVDSIEEAVCEARPRSDVMRRFRLEGPVMEELARLRSAVRACYGRREPYLEPPPATGRGFQGVARLP